MICLVILFSITNCSLPFISFWQHIHVCAYFLIIIFGHNSRPFQVSHEPHFTLLREVVNFNQNQRKSFQDPKNVTKTIVKTTSTAEFQLLHVAVLREYLQMDLCRDLYLLPAQVLCGMHK